MRTNLVVGNWKMNTVLEDAINLIIDIRGLIPPKTHTVVCVPFTHIAIADELTMETSISVGAQNLSDQDRGAFTGEVSGEMLNSLDVEFVIVGHSERRTIYNESNEVVAKKIKLALKNDLIPIFCCGESLKQRKDNTFFEFVKKQLEIGLFHLTAKEIVNVIIAYEPIWAIGTGETASPEQAQEVHAFIRNTIAEKYSKEVAEDITILYGGSVKPTNAKELFSCEDIDGGLIGGASLKAEDFVAIIDSTKKG